MIEVIQAVLERNKYKQLNLSSKACRQILAKQIADELEKLAKA
jgi:hypothetical protein